MLAAQFICPAFRGRNLVDGDTYEARVQHVADAMQKKLTLTIDEQVYEGLYRVVGAGRISEFIERLVRPHVLPHELEEAYADMARERRREEEAFDWSEGLIADLNDEKG